MATEYEIDAPKLFTHIAQRAIDQLFDLAEAKVKETLARHKNKNKEVFANYMQAQSERCALVRNLVSDNQSARLSDIYVYPVHVMTRKSFGLMMRKLSVTESQRSAQFPGTFSRRKLSVASANWAQVA